MANLLNITLLGLIEKKYTVDDLQGAWESTFNGKIDKRHSLLELYKFCSTAGVEIYKRIGEGNAAWAYFLEDLGEYVRRYVSANVDIDGDPIIYLNQIMETVYHALILKNNEIRYTYVNLLMAYYVGGWVNSAPFKEVFSIDFKDIFKTIEENVLTISGSVLIYPEIFCHALFTAGVGYTTYIKWLINLAGRPGFTDPRFERFAALKLYHYLQSVERYSELHCFFEKNAISNEINITMRNILSLIKEHQLINGIENSLSLTSDYKDFWRMIGE